jgi:hypothetical protein
MTAHYFTKIARSSAGIAFVLSLLGLPTFAPQRSLSGTTPFVLDGNRMYAELAFLRPDGSIHRALAFVDLGSPSVMVTESLFKELQLERKRPLGFRVGDLTVQIEASAVSSYPEEPYSVGGDLKVEGLLPAGVMQKYEIVIDYRRRTLTFAQPGTYKPEGVPVPARVNQRTGLLAVEASVAGREYPVTIDNGSAYTWLTKSTVEDWLRAYPEWRRGVGAVGVSNMRMADDGAEIDGVLVRIPEIKLGDLVLQNVGALGAGPGKGFSTGSNFFDWYSTKTPVPVIGWIGGNVLTHFRLTIDYPNRMTWWLQQSELDPHELDQVGLTLKAVGGSYFVAAIATQNGKPTVDGVLPGDKLIKIDGLLTQTATWGTLFSALHGKPGEFHTLLLERNGKQLTTRARITAF